MPFNSMVSKMKKLIRESEWLRVYETGNALQYESKLLLNDMPVSAEELVNRWDNLNAEERWEFALAFQARGRVGEEDARLLEYLWEHGNSVIRSTLAPLLPLHPRKDTALRLLLAQIEREKIHRANYFQALEIVADLGSVEPLRAAYEQLLLEATGDFDTLEVDRAIDLITCTRALWRLTSAAQFRESIEKLISHPDAAVRRFAQLALDDSR